MEDVLIVDKGFVLIIRREGTSSGRAMLADWAWSLGTSLEAKANSVFIHNRQTAPESIQYLGSQ